MNDAANHPYVGHKEETMIALYTFAPQFCPNCGCRLAQDRGEYTHHVAHLCGNCRTMYQLVDEQHALAAATASGGDLEHVLPLAR